MGTKFGLEDHKIHAHFFSSDTELFREENKHVLISVKHVHGHWAKNISYSMGCFEKCLLNIIY